MNIRQLNRLISGFSDVLKYQLQPMSSIIFGHTEKIARNQNLSFRTCWYGSAGEDRKIIDIVNTFSSTMGFKINVFFLTDVSFFSYFDRAREISYIPPEQCKFISSDGPKSARACIFPSGQLGLEIGTTDELFEEKVIELGLRIDVACHAGGMAGPGPQNLSLLKAEYSLGFTPRSNSEMRCLSNNQFETEILKEVRWGLSFDGVSELRRIIAKPQRSQRSTRSSSLPSTCCF